MPVLVIQSRDRNVQQEMEHLVKFARENETLAFTRTALYDASRVAVKEGRYSSDGFERAWRNHYDDASKLFKKLNGWTPLAAARELAAKVEATATRYKIQE